MVDFQRQLTFKTSNVRPGVRSGGRSAGLAAMQTSSRTVVDGTRVVSGAEKNKSFDRGGPVWPPRSNAEYDRLGGILGAAGPSENQHNYVGWIPVP